MEAFFVTGFVLRNFVKEDFAIRSPEVSGRRMLGTGSLVLVVGLPVNV
jgi:hypothetical protein